MKKLSILLTGLLILSLTSCLLEPKRNLVINFVNNVEVTSTQQGDKTDKIYLVYDFDGEHRDIGTFLFDKTTFPDSKNSNKSKDFMTAKFSEKDMPKNKFTLYWMTDNEYNYSSVVDWKYDDMIKDSLIHKIEYEGFTDEEITITFSGTIENKKANESLAKAESAKITVTSTIDRYKK